MYDVKIKTSYGGILDLNYYNDFIVDVERLTGIIVDVHTSQGFNQIGETVTGESIKGISRPLQGKALSLTAAQRLVNLLLPKAKGELIINDNYVADFFVKRTPEVKPPEKTGERKFFTELYFPIPFWHSPSDASYELGGFEPAFEFPTTFDEHQFGVRRGGYINCKNNGAIEVPFDLEIATVVKSGNFLFENLKTSEIIKINETINTGETLVYSSKGDSVSLLKKSADGAVTDVYQKIDESTDLRFLLPGDNLIKMTAAIGDMSARATLSAPTYYPGVVV